MINIQQKFIPKGQVNRPATHFNSSVYGWEMKPRYITIHNAWSYFHAERLNSWMITSGADAERYPETGGRLAGWHFSVDESEVWQGLPLEEPAWHAGDWESWSNPGVGNTESIGIEICDYAILYPRDGRAHARDHTHPDYKQYLKAEERAAKLCAYLILTLDSLEPFPDCMKMHRDWNGGSCPYHIRSRPNGWQELLDRVECYLEESKEDNRNIKHRVLVGSYKSLENARTKAEEIKRDLRGSVLGKIVYNKIKDGRTLFRVVAAEYPESKNIINGISNQEIAEAKRQWLEGRGYPAFVVAGVFEDLPIPDEDDGAKPEPDPEDSALIRLVKQLVEFIRELVRKIKEGKDK